jgi:hypothetical protein
MLPSDARRLATRIVFPHQPAAAIHRPRRNPDLAIHLIWPVAAGLLVNDASGLRLTSTAPALLRGDLPRLYDAFLDETCWSRWDAAAADLGLAEVVPEPYRLLARQSLQRQARENAPFLEPLAVWETTTSGEWRFGLRTAGNPGLLFDLLALGHYDPPGRLRVSPLTLGAPPARHLGLDRVRQLLETATGYPLDESPQSQLRSWMGRIGVYRLHGTLLRTARPEQLATLYTDRGLRPYLTEQLGPRCALYDRAGLRLLRRRLATLGYPLEELPALEDGPESPLPPDAAAMWLGLRLLAGLQRTMLLPGDLRPEVALERLAATLPADAATILEARADRLLADLHSVIQGRDAFFPAREPPPAGLIDRLRAAIAAEETVVLDYRPPGDDEPKRHTVEPLRLEQRDALIYLVAYSYRAEATLTFRLDRVLKYEIRNTKYE